jgi:hypothetical protein
MRCGYVVTTFFFSFLAPMMKRSLMMQYRHFG